MPRTARASVGEIAYHVLNRGNAQMTVFHDADDYAAFEQLLADAQEHVPMRLLGYCLLPNHFHLVVWPRADGDLSRWMQWLLTAHVRRHHRRHGSSGHVWQGRFKACPIQQDEHLLTVLRYVERNPRRAGLVRQAERWRWSSLATRPDRPVPLTAWPVDRPRQWLSRVNAAETAAELEDVRRSVQRGTPVGEEPWVRRMAVRLGLESTLRPRGRPRKEVEK